MINFEPKGDQVLVDVDIRPSSQLDMSKGPLWKLLSWAARSGRISAVLAGPPCRTFPEPGPGPVRLRNFPYG